MELSIDKICDQIIEGLTYREIAEENNTTLSKLVVFLSVSEHSARAREALNLSADIFADMAEDVIKQAQFDKENGFDYDLKKARELAHHYRWKAAKRNPKRYSDKVDVTTDGNSINTIPVINWVNGDQSKQ